MKNYGIELVIMKSKIKLLITGCMGRMGKQLIKTSNKDKHVKLVALTESKPINKKISGIVPELNTEVPVSLNKEQKELLEKFREIENEKSNPSIKKFFQKAKDFWKN